MNQDSLALCQLVVRRKRCFMGVVCDGIGSFARAEEASGFVTEELVNWFFRDGVRLLGKRNSKRRILNAGKRELFRIHQSLCDYWKQQRIGTTLSLFILRGQRYYLWNVGDSRIYRGKRNQKSQLLTVDDVQDGRLTRGIGSFSWQGVYVRSGRVKRGEGILLCSDGFYRDLQNTLDSVLDALGEGEETRIKTILREAAERNRYHGEQDDISAIYVRLCRGKTYGYSQ